MNGKFLKRTAASIICGIMAFSAVSCKKEDNSVKFTDIKAESTVSDMEITGYAARILYGNIENWTISALEKNPGIIDQIAEGAYARYITDITVDRGGLLSNQKMKAAVEKDHGANGGRSLMLTGFQSGTEEYLEFNISVLESAATDFSGFSGILFYADTTNIKDGQEVPVGIGFTEKEVDADGDITGGRETWFLDASKKYYTRSVYDGSWTEFTTESSYAKLPSNGRVIIQPGFKGWIYIPNADGAFKNLESSGETDGVLTGRNVSSLLFTMETKMGNRNRGIYFSDISAVVQDGGDAPSVDLSGTAQGGVKEIFTPEDLALGECKNSSGWETTVWFNEYAGKLLTGVSLQYAAQPSEELKSEGDAITEGLSKAMKDDGYLGIYTDEMRFGNNGNWDVWGHYHLIYGLITWYRATGNKKALETAKKSSDCVYDYFMGSGKTIDSVGNQTMNLAICHSFAELYKETKNKKYLNAAEQIVNEEWPLSGDWMNEALEGKDFYQSSLPRWEAIHCILALGTLYEITGKKDYFTAFENIWWSIAKTDRRNSGAFSTTEQAQGNPYGQGSVETCCTVAWQAFTSMYLAFSRNSKVADELELSYFNAMAGAVLEDERLVTYDTPTEGKTRVTAKSTIVNDVKFLYHSGATDFTCCQANAARGIGEISSWAAMTDINGVYLNYYGEGTIKALTPSGKEITIRQETVYPLNGEIKITLGLENDESFDLSLRIPSWSGSASVKVNGAEQENVKPGEYFTIGGTHKSGDVIELSIDVGFHVWVNEQDSTLASVYYGPVLLACFSADGVKFASSEYFTMDDFKNAEVSLANDGQHWLQFKVSGKTEYTFYDFATIGKYKAYKTWIKVGGIPEAAAPEKFGTAIWCR